MNAAGQIFCGNFINLTFAENRTEEREGDNKKSLRALDYQIKFKSEL